MTFSKSGNIDRIKYKLTNNETEHVREYKYLGFEFTTNGSMANGITQWLRASKIFRQICKATSEWRGFDSRWFYQSGFEFAKTQLSILNH